MLISRCKNNTRLPLFAKRLSALGAGIAPLILAAIFCVSSVDSAAAQRSGNNANLSKNQNKKAKNGTTNISELERLNIVTDAEYPPFQYYDEEGTLTGFNIDLARALCLELDVQCNIRVEKWENLIPSLANNTAHTVISAMAINQENLSRVDFTESYFRIPARFVARANDKIQAATHEALEDKKIGVIRGTSHEAYLKDFFKDSEITSFSSDAEAKTALASGKVDYLFSDGVSLMFWVNGTTSNGCCKLIAGAFLEPNYFGLGMGIAVRKGNLPLRKALNDALKRIRTSGRYEELLLRYFPLSLY